MWRMQSEARRNAAVQRGFWATAVVGVLILLPPGCVSQAETAEATASEPGGFSNAFASPNALGRAVLTAIQEDDPGGLEALRVTREEYVSLLWDQLPESGNTPLDFVWQLNQDNSREGRRSALAEYGGQEFELIGLRFTEAPEVYSTFVLHFGGQLWVRRKMDGEEGVLPLVGVVVEHQGHWKLLSFAE
jgi:hypothetical protein